MKKRMIFMLLIILGFLSFGAGNIYASNVRVYRDGVEVDFTKVKDESGVVVLPQIIKDRLMVPIRQTSEIFGINLVWNPDTGTMTMTKDGVVSTHTLYTNKVTINGVTKTYDTPSMVVSDRTLMPNIMIADIINCDTWWEAASRSVIMRSRPKEVPKPEVISVTSSKSQVMVGEELIVTAMANEYTTSVNLLDSAGRVLATSSQYVQTGNYRSFTLRYTPTTQTIAAIQYKVQAGDASGYNNEAIKTVLVSVTQGISVSNAYADEAKPYLNENAKIQVVATDGVTRVRLTDKSTNKTYEQTVYAVVSAGGNRTFTFDIKMTEKGDKTFSIEVGTDVFYVMDDKTVSLTVQGERPSDPISINDITYDNRTYYAGDTVYVSVRTSLSAVEVEIYDNYNRTTSRYTSYKDSSNYRTFEISVKLNSTNSNSFTAIAYDSAGKKYEKTFSIGSSYGSGKLIKNVTHTRDQYYNDYVLIITTDPYVNDIRVYDDYGSSYPVSYSSTENGLYVWKATIPSISYYYLTILAYNNNGEQDQMSYMLNY